MKILHPVVLASGSPRRHELLTSILGNNFIIKVSNVDETVKLGENPIEYCLRMSNEKGYTVKKSDSSSSNSVIISADTIVVLGEEMLGKPSNKDENSLFLQKLSSKIHQVYTAVTVILPANVSTDFIVETKVKFKYSSVEVIKSYSDSNEGLDKAGGYAIQGIGSSLIDSIEGSYSNVVGLPTSELIDNLKKLNVIQ